MEDHPLSDITLGCDRTTWQAVYTPQLEEKDAGKNFPMHWGVAGLMRWLGFDIMWLKVK